MKIETNGHTATLTVSTQAEADEGVVKLLAKILGLGCQVCERCESRPQLITRRELVIDGATEWIDLEQCGAIVPIADTLWHESRIDKVTVRNCPGDFGKVMELICGHSSIEFEAVK